MLRVGHADRKPPPEGQGAVAAAAIAVVGEEVSAAAALAGEGLGVVHHRLAVCRLADVRDHDGCLQIVSLDDARVVALGVGLGESLTSASFS